MKKNPEVILGLEDTAEFEAFRRANSADLKPVGGNETTLADLIIDARWRLKRAASRQTAAETEWLKYKRRSAVSHEITRLCESEIKRAVRDNRSKRYAPQGNLTAIERARALSKHLEEEGEKPEACWIQGISEFLQMFTALTLHEAALARIHERYCAQFLDLQMVRTAREAAAAARAAGTNSAENKGAKGLEEARSKVAKVIVCEPAAQAPMEVPVRMKSSAATSPTAAATDGPPDSQSAHLLSSPIPIPNASQPTVFDDGKTFAERLAELRRRRAREGR